MNKTITLCFVLLVSASYAQSVDKRLQKLDKELNEILTTWNAPGFAVAVVEKNRIVYAKGFGYRDYENKIPADANTLFAIGSCTKAFTSSLLGILRGANKVDFDESPRTYIPYLQFYNDEMNNEIIVKDLMTHRTGLPRHDFSWYLSNSKYKDSLLMRVKYMEPFAAVREKWYYNNFMFLAQGVITEKVTGKSWEENIQEQFFKPLGMTRSNLDYKGLTETPNTALGYQTVANNIQKMDYFDISGMAPAGSINSSANEMANWVITWINGGKFNGKEIIPSAYVNEAMSSQMVITGALPEKETPDLFMANYGYGWFMSSYKGHYLVQHGGNIDGFSANTAFFPSDSLGIVVLTNQNGSAIPTIARNIIADKMLSLKIDNWNAVYKKRAEEREKVQKDSREVAEADRVKGTKPSHNLAGYTGAYTNPGYGKIMVSLHNDSLFASFSKHKLWLEHFHYDIFRPHLLDKAGKIDKADEIFPDLHISYTTNTQGEISTLSAKIEPALDHPIEFVRKPEEIKLDAKTLEAYVGEYLLDGATVKVYTKDKTKLYVLVPGQPEYELMAIGKDIFAIKILEGYKLEFTQQEKGLFQEAVFKQPNGNFVAKRK